MLEKFVVGEYVPFHTLKAKHLEYTIELNKIQSIVWKLKLAMTAHDSWFQFTRDENLGLASESDDTQAHEKIALNLRDWGMREKELDHNKETLKEHEVYLDLLSESVEAIKTYVTAKINPSMPDKQIMGVMEKYLTSIVENIKVYPGQLLFNEFLELQKCFWSAFMRKNEIQMQMNMSAMRQAQFELDQLGIVTSIYMSNAPLDPEVDPAIDVYGLVVDEDDDEDDEDDEEEDDEY